MKLPLMPERVPKFVSVVILHLFPLILYHKILKQDEIKSFTPFYSTHKMNTRNNMPFPINLVWNDEPSLLSILNYQNLFSMERTKTDLTFYA